MHKGSTKPKKIFKMIRKMEMKLFAGHQLMVTGHQLLVASHQLLITSYQLIVNSYQLLITSYQSLVTKHQLLVTSYQSLATSYQSLATSHYSLVVCVHYFSFTILTIIRAIKWQSAHINKTSNINKIITVTSSRNQDMKPH